MIFVAILILFSVAERVEIVVEDGQRIISPLVIGEGTNIKSWTIRCNSSSEKNRCRITYANRDSPMISLTGHHAREVILKGIDVTQENGAKANFPLLDFTDVASIQIENCAFHHIHRPFYHGGVLSVVSSFSSFPSPISVNIHNTQIDNCTALVGGAAFISADALDLSIADSSFSSEGGDFIVEKCCRQKLGITRSSFINGAYFEIDEMSSPLPHLYMVENNNGDLRNILPIQIKRDGGSGKSAHSDSASKSEEGGTGRFQIN